MLNFIKPWMSAAILIALVGWTISGVWSFSAVSSRVDALEDWHSRASPILQGALQSQSDIEGLKETTKRIDENVNWIVRQMILKGTTP